MVLALGVGAMVVPRGMPGNRMTPKGKAKGDVGAKQPRKPRKQGFGHSGMEPSDRIWHVLDECSDCGTGLSGGWEHRTREVIEIPMVPARVTEPR